MSSSSHSTHSSSNVVGVHYRVGKKIGEGSFGIIYEGNLEWITCAFCIRSVHTEFDKYVVLFTHFSLSLHVAFSCKQVLTC